MGTALSHGMPRKERLKLRSSRGGRALLLCLLSRGTPLVIMLVAAIVVAIAFSSSIKLLPGGYVENQIHP